MVKPFVRRPVAWMLLVGLLVLVFVLSACGESSSSSTTTSPTTQPTTPPTQAASANTITIREQTGGKDIYTFDPPTLTVSAGQTVTFNNQSDEYHLLITTDAAGKPMTDTSPFTATSIVPTSRDGGTTTTLQVVFSKPGTYHYTSKLVKRLKDGNHPEGDLSQGKGTIIVQ